MYDTDVLIIGAGPTGLTLAVSLAAGGVDAMIVDRQAEGANTSRAAAVNARTLEVLEGLDVARRMIKEGVQSPTFTIRDGRRTLMTIDFRSLPTAYPFTLGLSQADTERLLTERLAELGSTVLRPKTVTGIEPDDEGVTVTFEDGDAVRARYVVGADGMRSVVRESAGIEYRGHEYAESFVLADVMLTGETPSNEVVLFWDRAGLTVVAPLPGGTFRIVAPVADAPDVVTASFVQELLDRRGLGPGRMVIGTLIWTSRFKIHHRVADTYRAGRLVLAGDAAHVHSPAGGQGMNLGIQDAAALGDYLTRVLAGEPETLLDDYSAERRPIAQQVLELTGRLTTLATLPAAVRPLRNIAIATLGRSARLRHGLAMRLSGLVYR